MQRLLDEPKHYDIVSFDPRGVFHSTPNAYCFDNPIEAEVWSREKRATGLLDSSHASLRYHWAMELARGRLCAETTNGVFEDGNNIRNFMSTAYVARDMRDLVLKLRESRLNCLCDPVCPQHSISTEASEVELRYIGTSYGAFPGQTFASLYPEFVTRMVLDSNVDVDNSVSWDDVNVQDEDAVRAYFFERCFAVRSACLLWRPGDSGASDIVERYLEVLATVANGPVVVAGQGHVRVITVAELESGFFTALYQPTQLFEPFAHFLHAIYNGTQPPFPFWGHPPPTALEWSDETSRYIFQSSEAGAAIACSDDNDLSGRSRDGFETCIANATSRSRFPHAGVTRAEFELPCWTWPSMIRAKWRYTGPFNGSTPMLLVNNRLDPITPLRNAEKIASRFNGSRVLVHERAGHGALWPVSDCVWDHVKRYMQFGTLPGVEVICDSPCKPFDECCEPGSLQHGDL